MKALAILAMAMVVAACGEPQLPPPALPEMLRADTSQWVPMAHLRGDSCQVTYLNDEATETYAHGEITRQARALGATALVGVRCRPMNMYECSGHGFRCEGEAVRPRTSSGSSGSERRLSLQRR